jgi:hypothetical protein
MRKLTVAALLAVAIGALLHFWADDQSPSLRPEPKNGPSRDSPPATASNPAPQPQPSTATRAPSGERVAQGVPLQRSAATPVQVIIHAPQTAQLGETVPVTIEVRAAQGIRQLQFSVVYNKQILELVESSPGVFARPGGPSAQFEEVSEGSLLVRIGFEGGVIAGAGSAAVVQFRTVRRGVSPLAINTVTYVIEGRQNESNDPVAYEGTITVE